MSEFTGSWHQIQRVLEANGVPPDDIRDTFRNLEHFRTLRMDPSTLVAGNGVFRVRRLDRDRYQVSS